ncbi:MAG TPA: sugar phosphate isomerase/epimerase family protein [Rhizobiaceae bacterium]|nr:sugar phosphate isomerase/epimerase family protein [Rhizobiaceae bacterium]
MKFPISLCSEVLRDLDFRAQCAFARAVGYDGLEIAPFTLSEAPHRLTPAAIAEFRSVAAGEGIAISGLHWLLASPAGLSITSADPSVFDMTVDFGRRLVELCAELGGAYLVHGSPGQRQLVAGREAEGRERGIAYFAAMAEAAAGAGVRYYIEPLARKSTGFVTRIEDALAIIDTIGSPSLGTMVDCYAAASNGEDIPALLRQWTPKGVIRHVHLNDPNGRGPGEGMLAFAPIIGALSELGYAGTMAVEPFTYEPDGPVSAARSIGYIRGIIEAGGFSGD